MAKKTYEFDTRYSDIEQSLEERKNRIKTIFLKTCSKCGETKPIFKFSVNKRNLEGRTNICKECRSREYLRYYYQNRERIKKYNREYKRKHRILKAVI
ncbi:hypothetical protein ES695_20910 [Candidatus Atribacteria bacterium 1244-E10-H5-B2]|nr:MAG: hypothetical protein ES695_20910 [Candidatus Atribacteria bacterium 1244-E10-H5-B2]